MKNGESTSPNSPELADRIREGDVSAFDGFVAGEWPRLVRFAVAVLGNVDDAKDVAQEAFVRLWEQRSALRPSSSVRAYVYQIARNLAISDRRNRELHRTLEERQSQERPPVRTPARDLESTEVREVVRRAIESLPERRREVFVLAHLQDLPYQEVAEVLGISRQTVANQISAALTDLREALRPYITEPNGNDLQNSVGLR